VNLGLSIVDPSDPAVALGWMDKARAIDPKGWLAAHGKATVYAFAGRHDEALHWDLQALQLDPHAGYPLAGAARRHLELDDLEGARTWFERVTESGLEVPRSFSDAALLALYSGESGPAVVMARRALAYDPRDPGGFRVLDADALRRGDHAAVVAIVRANFPDLAGPEPLRIRRTSVVPATDLALALRLSGDVVGSDALLDAVVVFLETARREGGVEFLVDEIRVAAIRGDRHGALQSLEALVAGGWRGEFWRYYRDHDPAFDALRTDPRFGRAFAVVEQDIARQRARAAESGDLARGPPGADRSG
jgi:tetratricopeptide (TPR) repeat protein